MSALSMRALLLAAAIVLVCDGAAHGDVGETIRTLGAHRSRVTGYPGADRAADYIESRLRAAGVGEVTRDSFSVVVPVEKYARMALEPGGEVIDLAGLWPNQVRTTTIAAPESKAQAMATWTTMTSRRPQSRPGVLPLAPSLRDERRSAREP